MHPERNTRLILLILAAVLLWGSWFFRYDLRVIDNQAGYALAYRLDRWTGNVQLLDNDQWYPVVKGDPEDLRQSLQSNDLNS